MTGNDIEQEIQSQYLSILKTLRGSNLFWHRTSLSAFRAILESGSVIPNTGQFDITYPQSKACYGRSIGAVCLFDFDTESLDAVLSKSGNWGRFLVDRGAATLVIGIDGAKLDPSRLSFAKSVREYQKTFIPFVEVWYRGDVATSKFDRLVLVKSSSAFEHEVFPFDATAPEKIELLASAWAAADEEKRATRIEPTLAELVEQSLKLRGG